jgi:hypothetical protein
MGACPDKLEPQHWTLPSLTMPQPWYEPTLMALNEPDGGVDCPSLFEPQQTMVPLVVSPHVL